MDFCEHEYRNTIFKLEKKLSFSNGTFNPVFSSSINIFVLSVNTGLKFCIVQKGISHSEGAELGCPSFRKRMSS